MGGVLWWWGVFMCFMVILKRCYGVFYGVLWCYECFMGILWSFMGFYGVLFGVLWDFIKVYWGCFMVMGEFLWCFKVLWVFYECFMGWYGCFMGILRIWGFIGMLWVFLMVLIYLIKITQQMQIETPTLFIDNKSNRIIYRQLTTYK